MNSKLTPQERQARTSAGLKAAWKRRKAKMAYRPDGYDRLARGRTVPEIAMSLHMAITGATDPYDSMEQDADALQIVLLDWHKASLSPEFDGAVRLMVMAVLAEWEAHRSKT